jgi:hypothetical protein
MKGASSHCFDKPPWGIVTQAPRWHLWAIKQRQSTKSMVHNCLASLRPERLVQLASAADTTGRTSASGTSFVKNTVQGDWAPVETTLSTVPGYEQPANLTS